MEPIKSTTHRGWLHKYYLLENEISQGGECQPISTHYYCNVRANQLLSDGCQRKATRTQLHLHMFRHHRLRDNLLPCYINRGQIIIGCFWTVHHSVAQNGIWHKQINLNQLCIQTLNHWMWHMLVVSQTRLKMLVTCITKEGVETTQITTS
jgi:hypothetical protein